MTTKAQLPANQRPSKTKNTAKLLGLKHETTLDTSGASGKPHIQTRSQGKQNPHTQPSNAQNEWMLMTNPIWKRTGMTNCGMMPFHAAEVLRQGKLRQAAHQVL